MRRTLFVVSLLWCATLTHRAEPQGLRRPPGLRSAPRDLPTDRHVVWWPSSVCIVPTATGATATVTQGCACGETLGCTGRVEGEALALEVFEVGHAGGSCDDCTATRPATCSVTGDLRAVHRLTIHGAPAADLGAGPVGCHEAAR